jgi:hypothetical protein
MIGQYLSNNNEKTTVLILQKNFASKPALVSTSGMKLHVWLALAGRG